MALVITKEELMKTLSTPTSTSVAKPVSTSTIDKVLDFLNNPAIQQIILRIFNRFFPSESPTSNPIRPQANISIDANKIYSMLLTTLQFLTAQNPNMTVKELQDYMVKEKDKVVKVIENATKAL